MQQLRVVPASDVDARDWDAFVENCDDAWFWHTSAYREAIGTWPTRSDVSAAVIARDGVVVAVLPLHVVRLRLGRVLPFVELDSQGGPACADRLDGANRAVAVEALADYVRSVARTRRARAVRV